MNVTQVEAREVENALINERPSQVHDTVPKVDPQEAAALEAIRKGLGLCGIEHDDWYWMANKILDVLKKSGILPFGVEDVIRKVLPNTVEAINALLTAYNTENLRHSLMEYPRRIREARQTVNQARKALKDAELERATIEAELVLAISTETDEKGKTKYSNAEARAAELLRRKASDPRYLEADQKVSMAEAEFNEASDTLQQLIDEYQSLRFAARLVVAELSMLSELAALEEIPEIQNREAF